MEERTKLLNALETHINQRTGMDWRNYGDRRSFMTEYREVLRDGKDARTMLRAIRWRIQSIPYDMLADHAKRDRLTYTPEKGWDYCVGQYWPTEYRSAVCRYLRDVYVMALRQNGADYDAIKKEARKEFGRGIVNRWFY